jgi:pyruvate,water dikinase
MLADLYQELFPAASALEPYQLLEAFDNKTLETDHALWCLGRQALAVPEVAALLQAQPAAAITPALEALASSSPAACSFLEAWHAFLQEYGRRDYTLHELADPSWLEDPTPALSNLQTYLTQPERDPQADLAARAAARERLVADARERLRGYPRPVVERFEFLLKAAQEANLLAEDHNFWIDGRSLYCVRRVLLEWGRRLTEVAAIEQQGDVFYLTLDELRELGRKMARGQRPGHRRRLVAARQAEMTYFRTIQPPPALGTPPSGPPPPDTPIGRAMGRFFGEPPRQEGDPRIIRGHAGSPGVVRGPAKVISTLAEAARLRQGDVLVTTTTAPAWTPLFATVAAIVTDAGGPLGHCAVVAREYGLPAVVATGVATTCIQDGQLLEVDGAAGVVRILS